MKILLTQASIDLKLGKPLLQIDLPGVGSSEEETESSSPTVNMKRMCDVVSGELNSPSRVHLCDSCSHLFRSSLGIHRHLCYHHQRGERELVERMMIPIHDQVPTKLYITSQTKSKHQFYWESVNKYTCIIKSDNVFWINIEKNYIHLNK